MVHYIFPTNVSLISDLRLKFKDLRINRLDFRFKVFNRTKFQDLCIKIQDNWPAGCSSLAQMFLSLIPVSSYEHTYVFAVNQNCHTRKQSKLPQAKTTKSATGKNQPKLPQAEILSYSRLLDCGDVTSIRICSGLGSYHWASPFCVQYIVLRTTQDHGGKKGCYMDVVIATPSSQTHVHRLIENAANL